MAFNSILFERIEDNLKETAALAPPISLSI